MRSHSIIIIFYYITIETREHDFILVLFEIVKLIILPSALVCLARLYADDAATVAVCTFFRPEIMKVLFLFFSFFSDVKVI